ncbi:hypothetical protein TcCL_NonESM03031 [Trypanosoma cruzi]|uniref:Uncharacterized protein n=1 Tax=Trypanosoma cruzi (strain CL Brener) TaxID=353153 RepID=Q4DEA5_TRYCC|nr:hypothetical protein Tc00.1047053510519.110 [Trypanosoma cruzi]EAN90863.1 hypothetical protein Tc00.1047053510519.110 [Trypanosoma cruzi]RNC47138.1 hypothetical protein TcCL_NonESM03031 [Trypanosoma cruzi]|eukprot:XP_812714.1 hypothetical protein [Trypanosoma cruzi strain CL Brener]
MSSFDRIHEKTAPSLELLRAQLQHMRSFDPHTAISVPCHFGQRGIPVSESGEVSVFSSPLSSVRDAFLMSQEKWDANDCMLQQLDSRLRLYQENGAKKRGDLVIAMDKAHTEMEQLQNYAAQFWSDMEENLRLLRQLLADSKNMAEDTPGRPEARITKIIRGLGDEPDCCADNRDEDECLMSRLEEMRRTQDVIRQQLEESSASGTPSSIAAAVERIQAELQKERDGADAQLSALKESFVIVVQKTLDELEVLRRDRLETEALCLRILS